MTNNDQVIAWLTGLAQSSRLDIFRQLVRVHSPDPATSGLPAGELGTRCGVAPSTLSFHLKEMRTAGLIESSRRGRSIIYRANLGAVQALVTYLLEDCCGGACGIALTTNIEEPTP